MRLFGASCLQMTIIGSFCRCERSSVASFASGCSECTFRHEVFAVHISSLTGLGEGYRISQCYKYSVPDGTSALHYSQIHHLVPTLLRGNATSKAASEASFFRIYHRAKEETHSHV